MKALTGYLFKIVCCGFLVSLAESLPLGKQGKLAARLCGGCLMILTVIQPLFSWNGTTVSDWLSQWQQPDAEGIQRAEEQNDLLMQRLVEERTTAAIQAYVDGMDAHLKVKTTAVKDESLGTYLPWQITLSGTVEEEAMRRIQIYLQTQWGIPPERQRWEPG